MPLNRMENMPASFATQNFIVTDTLENLNVLKISEQPKEGKPDGYVKVAFSESVDGTGNHYISLSAHDIGEQVRHKEVRGSHNLRTSLAFARTCDNFFSKKRK